MNGLIGVPEFAILFGVLTIWIWAVVDLLKRELSGPKLTKWLVIVLLFPILGFLLYLGIGRK